MDKYRFNPNVALIFLDALLLLFIGLKLAGILKWSWLWVTAPLWLPISAIFLIGLIAICVLGIIHLGRRKE